MAMLWAKYNQALAAQPLARAGAGPEKNQHTKPPPAPQAVKAFTSLTGFTLGDVLAQKGVEGKEERGAGASSGE